MERVRIPKLEEVKIGVWDQPGWYLAKHELNPSKDVVIFQCRFGHGSRIPPEASINRNGEIDPVMQCYCLKFKESVVLEDWPQWFYKLAGKDDITKLYSLTK